MKFSCLIGSPLRDVVGISPVTDSPLAADQSDSSLSLIFDVGSLDIKNPFVLKCDSGERVNFNSIIGCRVTDIFQDDIELTIIFDGRIALRISLREEDYIGAEAVVFRVVTIPAR